MKKMRKHWGISFQLKCGIIDKSSNVDIINIFLIKILGKLIRNLCGAYDFVSLQALNKITSFYRLYETCIYYSSCTNSHYILPPTNKYPCIYQAY